MKLQATLVFSAVFGAGILLAGCGGGQPPSAGSIPATNLRTTSVQPFDQNRQGRCQNGNVKIDPCRIIFNSSNPGPTTVTLGGEGDNGTITESDDCSSSGVATITKVDNRHYTAAPGTTAGSCSARFTNGGGQGNASHLHIINEL
ncbi:MAG TPA: hypothetical protein VMT95_01490 [Candidatus Binatia bacterium]|nr:hypothetical protein [Candidatus Binatia bacterium]